MKKTSETPLMNINSWEECQPTDEGNFYKKLKWNAETKDFQSLIHIYQNMNDSDLYYWYWKDETELVDTYMLSTEWILAFQLDSTKKFQFSCPGKYGRIKFNVLL